MQRIIPLLLLFLPFSSPGQSVRTEVRVLADSFARYPVLDANYTDLILHPSDGNARVNRLADMATDEELLTLIREEMPSVKCAAFISLAIKGSTDLIPIVQAHLTDTSKVETQLGCIISAQMCGDYFLEAFYFSLGRKDSVYFEANRNRMVQLDSMLLYAPNIRLAAKESRLMNIRGDSLYYDRVRDIAIHERILAAVPALASYQQREDTAIIQSYFENEEEMYWAIWAVRDFPDPSFYPYLVNVFEKEWKKKNYDFPRWRILYEALANYPNAQTVALFERTIHAKNKFRREKLGRFLALAVAKSPHPLFKPFENFLVVDQHYSESVK
ncbi:MAG: hypothetical protein NTW29_02330 [Bacteroidetes bacterium]|nr:hypothetical protein [Bacteroidota bacterium]